MVKTPDGKKQLLPILLWAEAKTAATVFLKKMTEAEFAQKAFDESKMVDPSLIIYNPVLKLDGKTIVTQWRDQTDTIYDFMKEGKCYRHALLTREFEPDEPNYTPKNFRCC